MIPNLRGWHRSLSGERITLRHPDGEHVAAIRYRESVRPLARMSVILDDLQARAPLGDAVAGAIERGVNDEGDYTAHAVVAGTMNGAPAQRDVGVVFGDDDYALLTGVSLVPARFGELSEHIKHLLHKDSHGRGLRRRRVVHRGPSGWQGLARGLTTEWQPPGYPAEATVIHVLPAHPVDEPVETVLTQTLADDADAGLAVAGVGAAEPIVLPNGLTGASWDMTLAAGTAARFSRVLVVLKDTRYLYVVRLESLAANRRPGQLALLEVLRSLEPLPAGGRPTGRSMAVVHSQWAD